MDWLNTINQTTEYIEEHIGDSIDFEEFSKSINVSYFYLLKMFKTITNIGLKEYVKNRRLSVSCYDLLNTNNNILDIAIKYGYNSNEAFTRAFKTFHDVTPKEVRDGDMLLKQYPMIHFNVSKIKLEDLTMSIEKDYHVTLYGSMIRYREDNSMAEFKKIDAFKREIDERFIGEVVYSAKSNYDQTSAFTYDLFAGVKNEEYNHLETFAKTVDKVICYRAIGNHPLSLRSLKQKIKDEWLFNTLEFNGELELECVCQQDDYYVVEYIISIN